MFHYAGEGLQDVLNVLGGSILPQGEPEGPVGQLVREADGHENMGGIQGARRTGASCGAVDSRSVKVQKEGLPLDADEAEVGVVGQPFLDWGAV